MTIHHKTALEEARGLIAAKKNGADAVHVSCDGNLAQAAYCDAWKEALAIVDVALAKANARRALVQGGYDPETRAHTLPGTISWEEHEEVWRSYAARYGTGQSAERMNERGGFGKEEAEDLLRRPLRTWTPR